MTDQQIHSELQYALVETVNSGSSYASGRWSVTEVAEALTRRQDRFLRATGIVVTRTSLSLIPNTPRVPLPQNWMAVRRLSWHAASGGRAPLHRMTWAEADYSRFRWEIETQPKPIGYIEPADLAASLELHLFPASFDHGVPELWYLALGTALSNTGVSFTVPDEFVAPIKWGALADLLAKNGDGFDLERSGWCEARYQEGVALTQIMGLEDIR